MFPWKIEILCDRKFLSFKIWFIYILQEEISICKGTGKNKNDAQEHYHGDNNCWYMTEHKIICTHRNSKFWVDGKKLVHHNPNKWYWSDDSHYDGIQKDRYFREIPMKKVLIQEDYIFGNNPKMGDVRLHKREGYIYRVWKEYICFSYFASVFFWLFLPFP